MTRMEDIRETWEALKAILIESRDVDDTILEEYKRMRIILLTLKIEGAHLSERGHPNGISPIADQLSVIMTRPFDLAMNLKKDEAVNIDKAQVLDDYFKKYGGGGKMRAQNCPNKQYKSKILSLETISHFTLITHD